MISKKKKETHKKKFEFFFCCFFDKGYNSERMTNWKPFWVPIKTQDWPNKDSNLKSQPKWWNRVATKQRRSIERLIRVLKISVIREEQNKESKKCKEKEKKNMVKPCEELRDGVRTEDLRFIAISDSVDLRLNILVSYDRHDVFESLSVGSSFDPVSFEVLHVSITWKDLLKNLSLDIISVGGHFLDELEFTLVLLREALIRNLESCDLWCFRHRLGFVVRNRNEKTWERGLKEEWKWWISLIWFLKL